VGQIHLFAQDSRIEWTGCAASCAVLICLLTACFDPQPPAQPDTTIESAATTGPLRYIPQYLAERQQTEIQPLTVPLDSAAVHTGSPATVTNGALLIAESDAVTAIEFPLQIPAHRYTELHVAMKVSRGHQCNVTWSGNLEPSFGDKNTAAAAILPSDKVRTYVLPLRTLNVENWIGAIERIRLTPTDVPAAVEIHSLTFHYRAPTAPLRVTLDGDTHDAVPVWDDLPAWRVAVPPQATFETYVGLTQRGWKQLRGDGARFHIWLRTANEETIHLAEKRLHPTARPGDRTWTRLAADLSPYAGQTITLSLTADPGTSTIGDYAYWANPIVYPAATQSKGAPVIFVSIDTLRADHLSCYGYERETTPHLDAFAKEAVLFENALVEEVWTLTSHMTMLTGLYPTTHGVDHHTNLSESVVTLPELLTDAGYTTAGFTGHNWWLLAWRGFAHGFDSYSTPSTQAWTTRHVFDTHARGLEWLDTQPADKVFLFLHNYDCHAKFVQTGVSSPYYPAVESYIHFAKEFADPPDFLRPGDDPPLANLLLAAANQGKITITDAEREYMIALYDDCIHMVDDAVHQLFQSLRERGLYDRALIVVTSDHGEAFGEHGLYNHNQVYEHCARVPLLIKFPGGRYAGRRVQPLVQLSDLYPTVAEVLNIEPPASLDGHSLVPLIEGDEFPRRLAYISLINQKWQAVRSDTWKLVRDTQGHTEELFNLVEDPFEKNNLFPNTPPELADLDSAFADFFQPPRHGWHLRFEGRWPKTTFEVTLRTDSQLKGVRILDGEPYHTVRDSAELSADGHLVSAEIRTWTTKGFDLDELVLSSIATESRLDVQLRADRPFRVKMPGAITEPATTFSKTLDSADLSESTDESDVPQETTVTIWFEAPDAERSHAAPLPDHAEEELRALGYIQ
jgi:arylsulfatase A-like enzyme